MYFDTRYNEQDWRRDSDAEELAQMRQDARDMEDYTIEATPRETNGEPIRVSGSILETIRTWGTKQQHESRAQREAAGISHMGATPAIATWDPIDENTLGPLVPLCDDSPIVVPARKVA